MMDYTAIGTHDFYTFLLVFSRVGGLVVTAPLLGNRMIPRSVKAGFMLFFSFALTPLVIPKTGSVPTHALLLAADLAKNAVFGLALGYLARALFSAVEIAGAFIDTQMGFGLINLFNPFTDYPNSVLSVFQIQLATTLYVLANGHLALLGALAESFNALPPSAAVATGATGLAAVPVIKMMFVLGFRLALPAAGVLLLVDVAFGLVARLVPQVNVFMVGTPAKILIGLATVALLLPVIAVIVGEIGAGTGAALQALVAAAK
ncbi:MAG TPA: flagellar biosynthetic protein FliR [Chthonomonadaceae bacterium]|nr:flagellar biosynthetic protein FliR [Chthonomonadaceae bacterium]